MRNCFSICTCTVLLLLACRSLPTVSAPQATIIDEHSLQEWTAINTPMFAWTWQQDTLRTSTAGAGYLRSPNALKAYTLRFNAYCNKGGEESLVLCSTALPETGSPHPDGIRIALLPNRWASYRITQVGNLIRVFANGKLIQANNTTGAGFISFMADSHERKFTNISLHVIENAVAVNSETEMDTRFTPLYSGASLDQWQMKPGHIDHWTAKGWLINYDGLSQEKDKCLWTKKSYRDFELIADVRLTRTPTAEWSPVVQPDGHNALLPDGSIQQVLELYAGDTGIYLRGNSKNQINIGYRYLGSGEIYGYRVDEKMPAAVREAVTPKVKADNYLGGWNRFFIRLVDDVLTVELNGITVINQAQLPGIAAAGPIALQDDHASNNTFQFANLFVREL